MSDLNILGMMRGDAPGYAAAKEEDGQKLAVLLLVSEQDTGRAYGGSLSSMSGRVNDPDASSLDVSAALKDVLSWMLDNDPSIPEDFTANVTGTVVVDDKLAVSIECGPEDRLSTTNFTI